MTLPTFPELMASLNLSSTGEPGQPDLEESEPESPVCTSASSPPLSPSPFRTATSHYLPSASGSPSIVISEVDQVQSIRSPRSSDSRSTRSLGRTNRFSPYLANNVYTLHNRRGSLPNGLFEVSKPTIPDRATSSSPTINYNTLRDVNIKAVHRAPCALEIMSVDLETPSDVPISSFVRRNTPQSSPTAPTFPHRERSGSFSPVLLPTLPPGLASPTSSHYTFGHSSVSTESADASLGNEPNEPRNRHQGLRISSYRPKSNPNNTRRAVSVQSVS